MVSLPKAEPGETSTDSWDLGHGIGLGVISGHLYFWGVSLYFPLSSGSSPALTPQPFLQISRSLKAAQASCPMQGRLREPVLSSLCPWSYHCPFTCPSMVSGYHLPPPLSGVSSSGCLCQLRTAPGNPFLKAAPKLNFWYHTQSPSQQGLSWIYWKPLPKDLLKTKVLG